MQESRLFKIVYHLLGRGQATAAELAEKFEVSVRTIYRDIDALSGAGIPIYAETGRNGGIRLMKGFVLDKAVLSEEERQEILTALQSINLTQSSGSQTLQKLSAIFDVSSESWLEVDFSRWGNEGTDNEKFELLKSAIVHHKCVKIAYASSYEIISGRIIWPLKLAYKARAWYVKAFCTEKQDWRIFKLNRILDLEILNEDFSEKGEMSSDVMAGDAKRNVPIPWRKFPRTTEEAEREYHQITLRFPKEMAYRVYDEFDKTQVERQESGAFIVSVNMPEDAWLVGFLLSFGTQVDILSPVSLRETVAKHARLIYEKNKA